MNERMIEAKKRAWSAYPGSIPPDDPLSEEDVYDDAFAAGWMVALNAVLQVARELTSREAEAIVVRVVEFVRE